MTIPFIAIRSVALSLASRLRYRRFPSNALAIVITIAAFGLIHGQPAFAHGESEPEPAKPTAAAPAEPPPPPRPTEYPRGLNAKPKPGEAPAAAAPPTKPGEAKSEEGKAEGAKPAESKSPPGAAEKVQAMPVPASGEKPGDAPMKDEATIPKPGGPATSAHWVPPKRYHFVMDTYTGLAMGGNDPVAFFVDGTSRLGSNEHELDWGGTTWHFLSEGNLAAFKENPEVYAPKFGGRCAFALSQGLLVEGLPQFFLIYRDRLYLFANAGYRAAFLTNPDALSAEAEREWPVLTRGEP